jgi:hypothetical protein
MYAFQHGIIASSNGGAIPSTLWDGLLAYYTADNTPNDALGTYNGTLVNGATYGTGKINNGFIFDGVNDYINLGNNFNFDNTLPFTVSAWVYTSSTTIQTYFSKLLNFYGYELTINFGTGIRFYIKGSNGGSIDLSINGQSENVWQNIVFTYDGSRTALGVNGYVNGVLRTKNITSNNLSSSSVIAQSAQISGRAGVSQPFNGIIDEIGIWNKVLTEEEVTELYNSGSGLQYS